MFNQIPQKPSGVIKTNLFSGSRRGTFHQQALLRIKVNTPRITANHFGSTTA